MRKTLQKTSILLFAVATLLCSNGCLLTKVVTVPMRLGGAIASIVPVVGNTAHDTVDASADTIDKLPF